MEDCTQSLSAKMKIGVVGVYHETNSFAPGTTEIDNFKDEWVDGKKAFFQRYAGTKTSMGGVIAAAASNQADLCPGLYVGATPSGMVSSEAMEQLLEALMASVPEKIDGLLVILHGAMVSERYSDVEAEVLKRLREKCSALLPIAVTLDLHANISRELVERTDIIVGYDTYPHIDTFERAVEAVDLLAKMIRREIKPQQHWQSVRMLVPPQAMITAEGPMHGLLQHAFAMEENPAVLNITVAGGFPYSDVEDAGMSVVVTTDDDLALAKELASELCELAWEQREQFAVQECTVDEAIQLSLSTTEQPDIFVEGSDNVGGGAPADATHTLRHLLQLKVKSLIVIRDQEAVQEAHSSGVGSMLTCSIGGKSDTLHGEPVGISGDIRLLFDGRFQHVGPYMKGQYANMGKTAVVEAGHVTILLTENRQAPWDIGHVRSVGLEPDHFKIIVVKAAVAWRSAFGPYAKQIFYLDTPGCCSANLQYFNYRRLRRPIYPLEPI